jgi:hypothetical protein
LGLSTALVSTIDLLIQAPFQTTTAVYEEYNWIGKQEKTDPLIEHLTENLTKFGVDLKSGKFKMINISNTNDFFECHFPNSKIPTIKGTADAAIIPSNCYFEDSLQLRVLIEFKTPETFDKKPGQIIGQLVASCYQSRHPIILLKTDLAKNFEIYQIRSNKIHTFANLNPQQALQAVVYWLNNICSDTGAFDFLEDEFNEELTYFMKYIHNEFKVKLYDEFKCMLKERLEVTEMADSELSSFDKYLSISQIFQSYFN